MIAVVTDSTSDLPPALAADHDIVSVPAVLVMGDRNLRDGQEMDRDEFYRRLPALPALPTTAAPSSGDFESAYAALLSGPQAAAHVLSIHAASRLSGIFNAAHVAAASFPGRVTVEDSEQLSLGLGFQALAAAEAARAGAGLAGALDAARDVRRRVRLFALLDTLQYLRRSGRVSFLRAGFGDALQVKLLVELARGEVIRLAQNRTRGRAVADLLQRVRSLGRLARLAVLHTGAAQQAADLSARLAGAAPGAPLIVNATTVIGVHVGPGALGVAALLA